MDQGEEKALKKIAKTNETKRLILKTPSLRYTQMLQSAIEESVTDLRLWLKWAQKTPSLAECTENISKAINAFDNQEDFQFYIFIKESNTFIGCAGLHRIDWSIPKVEIGYWVKASYQGHGYATEVSQWLTQFAFNELGVNRVEIRCDDNNTRSKSVAEKLGFVLEGVLRNDTLTPDGKLRSTAVFSRVKQDY